ncbi:LysR family transcriptional regulator [Curvibacter sp. CHRR-16]|uniref:LysR family transcriptional regulator n=1 Tax=Curvibacter sp. CHRR-16 TaxID=2835872 RepID=UPI001BD95432|nr:LysR family transcriptional regulator [Curvibacter sp. CHRR-16]MBT0568957.1 LysR family transcriptional regulator [Curvibacter sp. CHRR-16]
MQNARNYLTPDALAMLQTIHKLGSFAAAARELGLVPSALTYRVRQIEDALDVLLFDRSSRQAKLTEAGHELLREGNRLLEEIDAIANRVRRVATGWEPQLTIAVDTMIARAPIMELCESFLSQNPPTRIRLREETLAGTQEALTSGQADLAIGITHATSLPQGIAYAPLGEMMFVYAVAPHHILASAPEPLSDETIQQHRAIAIADTVQRGTAQTQGLLAGQDVLTVPSLNAKLDAQLRGLGGGNLPLPIAQPYFETGRLVRKAITRDPRTVVFSYAWRKGKNASVGRALQWWLQQLESTKTRQALMQAHRGNLT